MPRFKPNMCPKCGEPSRYVVMVLRVKVGLMYPILGNRIDKNTNPKLNFHNIKRAGGTTPQDGLPILSCSGGHEWEAEVIDD